MFTSPLRNGAGEPAGAADQRRNHTEHPEVAFLYSNLGLLKQLKGEYRQAEELYRRALVIQEEKLGPEHPDVAVSLENIGLLALTEDKPVPALLALQRAAFVQERNVAVNLGSGSEASRLKYLLKIKGMLDICVSLHTRFAQQDGNASRLALTMILQRKGRLLDMLTEEISTLRARLAPGDPRLRELLELRTRIAALAIRWPELDQEDPKDVQGLLRNTIAVLSPRADPEMERAAFELKNLRDKEKSLEHDLRDSVAIFVDQLLDLSY